MARRISMATRSELVAAIVYRKNLDARVIRFADIFESGSCAV